MILNRERKAIALRIYKLYRRCHHQLNPGSWSSHSQTILRLSLSRQLDLSQRLERSVCYEYHCRDSMYVFCICVAGKGIFGEGGKVLLCLICAQLPVLAVDRRESRHRSTSSLLHRDRVRYLGVQLPYY